jgi:acetylornithine deacetylase
MKQLCLQMNTISSLTQQAIELLQSLIQKHSLSKQENETADILKNYLQKYSIDVQMLQNNVWVKNKYFVEDKPTILLNSHHDTVPANKGYTKNPLDSSIEDGKLFGLGSNDAGGSLVSLLATFLYFFPKENLNYNLIFAATAEEEISGENGIELLYPQLGRIDVAIVGEPTQMQMAIAEKGLLVIDCVVKGKAGHAAREEGDNAIYKAMSAIDWFKNYQFQKISTSLGPVKMSVTIINAGMQHNMVPEVCTFTVDIRINELYTHEEILRVIEENVNAEILPRSMRMKSSGISVSHPLVQSGQKLGKTMYGSPTTSDKALMSCPSLKMGPGDSARSHSADEFIYVNEIEEGIDLYIKLLENIL